MKNFVQSGTVMTVTAPADTPSGGFVVAGAMFGIACSSAASGEDLELAIGGVFDVPKISTEAWSQGAALYYDNTTKSITTAATKTVVTDNTPTTTDNMKVGVAAIVAANPSATGRVRLNAAF